MNPHSVQPIKVSMLRLPAFRDVSITGLVRGVSAGQKLDSADTAPGIWKARLLTARFCL